MKRILIIAIILGEIFFNPLKECMAKEFDVVYRWAPIIEQQNYSRSTVSRDNAFTRVDFDGDWRLNNNSYNLAYYKLDPAVYYSVVESGTHYYIAYYLYYPRHNGVNKHEHDMIGALLAIEKAYDSLINSERLDIILAYSNGKWRKWNGDRIRLDNQRPSLVISAGTHEISLRQIESGSSAGGLYPALEGILNQAINSKPYYRLVDLEKLWQRRSDIGGGRTFNRWGYFDGYYFSDTAVPWVWQYKQFKWLSRPAELIQFIQGNQIKPEIYLNNHYR